jgi:hypothetical protein
VCRAKEKKSLSDKIIARPKEEKRRPTFFNQETTRGLSLKGRVNPLNISKRSSKKIRFFQVQNIISISNILQKIQYRMESYVSLKHIAHFFLVSTNTYDLMYGKLSSLNCNFASVFAVHLVSDDMLA